MPTSSASSDDRLSASRCPECGAPVDWRSIPPDQSQVECEYCGTLIRVPGRSPRPKPEPTVIVAGAGAPPGAGCSWVSALVGLLVVGVVVVLFIANTSIPRLDQVTVAVVEEAFPNQNGEPAAVTRSPGAFNPLPMISQALAVKVRLASRPYLLANNDQLGVQMVVFAFQDEGSILIGFDPTQRREGWRSPLLSGSYYEMGIASDAQRVYVADGAKLLALNRSDGRVAWQTSLANNLQTSCPESAPCLQMVGEQLVALARDGTLQGFVGATGAPLWSRRLNSTPRQLLHAGSKVLAIDSNPRNEAVVQALDGATGDPLFELTPACEAGAFGANAHISDQFVVTPDGTALLVLGSGTYACAWRYSLEDGSLGWVYDPREVDTILPFTWSLGTFVLDDAVVYYTDETGDPAQIWALDTMADEPPAAPLYTADQVELSLVRVTGDLLLAAAAPTYATDELELWAVDRTTGSRLWQRRLETTHSFDEWRVDPTDAGLFVAVCHWNEEDCRFMVLDPATGVSRAETQEALGWPFEGGTTLGSRGYFTIDGALHVIDLTTAQTDYVWP